MKVYFRRGSPLGRLETDPAFTAELASQTVAMYRCRMQQLRAAHTEVDLAASRALDLCPAPDLGPDHYSIHICPGQRLALHLLGGKPRSEVAVLEIFQVKQPARRLK